MEKSKKKISRLLAYKNTLHRLKGLGLIRVYSENIANACEVSSALVRKDFSEFGITGNKKGGYVIDDLMQKLNRILGKDEVQKVVLVGTGKLGQALINYKGFAAEGIRIIAGFDIDPEVISENSPVPLHPLSHLEAFIKNNNVRFAIISVPETAVEQVFQLLTASGIKGILNFAPMHLTNQNGVVVHNVNLVEEFESLFYRTKELSGLT